MGSGPDDADPMPWVEQLTDDAGGYAVICFIPTGSISMEEAETADGPSHFTQGMVREFKVEG